MLGRDGHIGILTKNFLKILKKIFSCSKPKILLLKKSVATIFGGEGVFCGHFGNFWLNLGVEIIFVFCYYIYYKLITKQFPECFCAENRVESGAKCSDT